MATFDRRLGKDGKQVYRARVRRKGYQDQVATFAKLSDAKRWAQLTEAALLEGKHFPAKGAKHYTVSDLIDRYICEVLPHKSTSSIMMQTQQLHWWRVQLGRRLLADITPALIAESRDRLLREGRANSTVNRYLAALSHAFTIAIREWGWLAESPMRKVRRPSEPRGRVRFLSDEERQRLLAACQASRNPYLYLVVVLALSTGARKMELLNLTWNDVDLQQGIIHFQHTKNGERRTLPLTGHALMLMCHHISTCRADSNLVFPNLSGKKPLKIRDAWENALTRAGIKDFRFHDLRHSAASYLAMNGASLAEIGEILGHRSLEMTRRYAHLSQAHTRTVLASMNETIFG